MSAMSIKLPLRFHINRETGEVHTIRYDADAETFQATCGKGILASAAQGTVSDEPVPITCDKCLDAYTTRFVWTVQITVHPTWVADGFDLTDERADGMLAATLPWANGSEFAAKVLSAPDADEIAMEQGYRDGTDRTAKG